MNQQVVAISVYLLPIEVLDGNLKKRWRMAMKAFNLLFQLTKHHEIVQFLPRIAKLPEDRLALLMGLFKALPSSNTSAEITSGLFKVLNDNKNFMHWLLKLVEDLADKPLKCFFQNVIVNEMIEGQRVRRQFQAREGFEPPVTIVINPTMACNLHCHGCYSYKMPRKGMDYALLRKVLREAREMGTRLITVSGGEPLIYQHYFRMLEEFGDLQFMSYTNATLIDEEVADRIAAAGNVMPAISVEGFSAETDNRRGAGVHDKVLRAMRLLKERGVLFGVSATPTRQNSDVIASDEFIDYYIAQGALFSWMFQYLPVGKDPDITLMSTPEQREKLRAKTHEWRLTKSVFIGDFWNDGPCVGGCLSATRYCYITPEGKVQPCTFVHFYTHDLNECTLLDVFRSKFFRSIRAHQPYSRNLLRPCKIIDNPEVLRDVVEECGAKPSYEGAETIIKDPAVRAHLDTYAREWGAIADRVWAGPECENGNSILVPFLGRINANERFYTLRVESKERMRAEEIGPAAPVIVAASLRGLRAGTAKSRR
jgi:MoaA/NifB/PqqE/SkfB family radical SAM enzyme